MGRPIASPGRRVGAVLIDGLIGGAIMTVVAVVFIVLMVLAASGRNADSIAALLIAMPLVMIVVALLWIFALSAMQARGGSVGQRATGVQVVRQEDGASPSVGTAFLRNIVFTLAGAIVVGYFSPLFDGSGLRRGWHDLATRTVMVERIRTASAPQRHPAAGAPQTPQSTRPGSLEEVARRAQPLTPAAAFVPPAPVPPARSAAAESVHPHAEPASTPPEPLSAPPRQNAEPVPAPTPIPAAPAEPAPVAPATASPAPVLPPASEGLVSGIPGFLRTPARTEPLDPEPAQVSESGPEQGLVPAPTAASELVSAPESAPAAVSEPAPVAAPVPHAEVAPTPEYFDETVVNAPGAPFAEREEDIDDTRLLPPRQPRIVVVWDDETEHAITGAAVFGRNPEPDGDAERVLVDDPTRSLSKTHFALLVEDGRVFVVDKHSTNGTLIGESQTPATPGERIPVAFDEIVTIGERTLRIQERR